MVPISLADQCVFIKDILHAFLCHSSITGLPRREGIVDKKVGRVGCENSCRLFLLKTSDRNFFFLVLEIGDLGRNTKLVFR